mmetsp:Transcript_37838/g.96083  ORF Transcript_37838/g.96083 Transcript_37838/m.96083 type:complete len:342 (-) Transcript_37838:2032-3057(-)
MGAIMGATSSLGEPGAESCSGDLAELGSGDLAPPRASARAWRSSSSSSRLTRESSASRSAMRASSSCTRALGLGPRARMSAAREESIRLPKMPPPWPPSSLMAGGRAAMAASEGMRLRPMGRPRRNSLKSGEGGTRPRTSCRPGTRFVFISLVVQLISSSTWGSMRRTVNSVLSSLLYVVMSTLSTRSLKAAVSSGVRLRLASGSSPCRSTKKREHCCWSTAGGGASPPCTERSDFSACECAACSSRSPRGSRRRTAVERSSTSCGPKQSSSHTLPLARAMACCGLKVCSSEKPLVRSATGLISTSAWMSSSRSVDCSAFFTWCTRRCVIGPSSELALGTA